MNSPLVVGYKGEIGSFILSGLLRIMPKALNIYCVDVNEEECEVIERIQKSDVIFLCVPIFMTKDWLNHYKTVLRGKIIIEQCSLKGDLYKDEVVNGLDVRGMHILFRPSQTPNLSDRSVALILPHFTRTWATDIEQITQSKVCWYNNIAEHDEEMARDQALTHRVLLTLAKEIKGYTYIGRRVKELAERISKGDPRLYNAIQNNKQLPNVLKNFDNALKTFDINNYM